MSCNFLSIDKLLVFFIVMDLHLFGNQYNFKGL